MMQVDRDSGGKGSEKGQGGGGRKSGDREGGENSDGGLEVGNARRGVIAEVEDGGEEAGDLVE
jgi:hypothetical protein